MSNYVNRFGAGRKSVAASAEAAHKNNNSNSRANSPRAVVAGECAPLARLERLGGGSAQSLPPSDATCGGDALIESLAHPDIGRTVLSHAVHVPGPRLAEESDSYPVVVSLNDRWRVVICKHSIQWILQKRRGGSNTWRGRYFCRTREALIRCAREYAGEIGGDASVILMRLPERPS